jgi:DNA-directed RNA polymerase specialized sigma24 family protein
MRGLVIDRVRARHAQKRARQIRHHVARHRARRAGREPGSACRRSATRSTSWSTLEPGLAEVVDLKFFCGFTLADIANMKGVSERTIQRQWDKARMLLHRALASHG